MPDRFDEAKRALEGVPAHDVWPEAERRAETGAVVPLAPVARPPRRYGRWIAAAAVLALVAGTVAVLAGDDGDDGLQTGTGTGTGASTLTTYQAGDACRFGITGAPLTDSTTVGFASPDGTAGTMLVGHLNDVQEYAVHVPGHMVIDLVGERVEDVQLRRGTAQIWFQVVPNDAVQVRWFPGSQDGCESFTVSVEGGTEDENRHAAVDLAERVVLPSELEGDTTPPHLTPGANPLADTAWQLERATVDGEPTGGTGALFSFSADTATWSDGCNDFAGSYELDGEVLVLGTTSEVTFTAQSCPYNPTVDAINDVMGAGRVPWSIDDRGFLLLAVGEVELVLRPPVGKAEPEEEDTDSTSDVTDLPGTGWRIESLADDGASVPLPDVRGNTGRLVVTFAPGGMSWGDGCNRLNATVTYGESIDVAGPPMTTLIGCEQSAGTGLINDVLGSEGSISVELDGDLLHLKRGAQVMMLERA
jgi:heat shock protein HslJ